MSQGSDMTIPLAENNNRWNNRTFVENKGFGSVSTCWLFLRTLWTENPY